MKAYVSKTVEDLIDEVVQSYETTQGDNAADEVEMSFRTALDQVATRPYSLARARYCPPNYRRANIPPYQIFYRMNEEKDELTFYLIRGGRQKPLAAATHRKLAGLAEQNRTEL